MLLNKSSTKLIGVSSKYLKEPSDNDITSIRLDVKFEMFQRRFVRSIKIAFSALLVRGKRQFL